MLFIDKQHQNAQEINKHLQKHISFVVIFLILNISIKDILTLLSYTHVFDSNISQKPFSILNVK